MSRRKLAEKNIRRIVKIGDSYAVTLPLEIVKELKWREKQKVEVKKDRNEIVIKDWKE